MIAVIKSRAQYDELLARASALIDEDPSPETELGRELEVLGVLIKDYEARAFPLAAPSPLAAIRLRMDQLDLSPNDLVAYLGSKSRVSEVLSGKRPLSIAMIRRLHTGLGISLQSLVSEQSDDLPEADVDWARFPVREMAKRGWLTQDPTLSRTKIGMDKARLALQPFFDRVGGFEMMQTVLTKTDHVRTAASTDRYALAAWACHVRARAEHVELPRTFSLDDWNEDGLRTLRSLSRFDVGPRLAVQYLEERGIVVDLVPHLPRTRLDGAAMLRSDGAPVIALTIRHDRVDNFWFTLFHELMHVLLHLRSSNASALHGSGFFDDLDVSNKVSVLEKEADEAARDALIPSEAWEKSAVRFAAVPATVAQLARDVGVSEAIVAGRVRKETENFRVLSAYIGAGMVRQQFPEVTWAYDR